MKAKSLTMVAALALVVLAPAVAQLEGESPEAGALPLADQDVVAPVQPPDDEWTATEVASELAVEPASAEPAEAPTYLEPALPDELPRTASPLALIALLGVGSVGSAIGLRFARRR
jgi:hypothetical protein